VKKTNQAGRCGATAIRTRTISVPGDLKAALSLVPALNALFFSLPSSHKKQYIDWITEAKRIETRKARVEKTLRMLAAKRPEPSRRQQP
jgi:uncharacterized protein YdeI (YjbR/CyaY-like superfamily)